MDNEQGRVLYIVRTWVPEEQIEEWNRWHTETHVHEVVAQPQVHRARKYRVTEDNTPAEWQAQYVTIYEFDSLRDFEGYRSGEEAARLRQDYDSRYGAKGKISRQVLVEVADVSPPGE